MNKTLLFFGILIIVLSLFWGVVWWYGRRVRIEFPQLIWISLLGVAVGSLLIVWANSMEGYSPTAPISEALFRQIVSEAVDLGVEYRWDDRNLDHLTPVSVDDIRQLRLAGKIKYFYQLVGYENHPVALVTQYNVNFNSCPDSCFRRFGDIVTEIETGKQTTLRLNGERVGEFSGKVSLILPLSFISPRKVELVDKDNRPVIAKVKGVYLTQDELSRLQYSDSFDFSLLGRRFHVDFGEPKLVK